MNNRFLISVICLSVAGIFVGTIGYLEEKEALISLLGISASIFVITGGYLLLKNGEFIKTREYSLVTIGIGIGFIGVLLKIMHWPYGLLFLNAAFLWLPFLYLSYLIRSRNHNWTKWVRLSFLIIFFASKSFTLMHWPYHDELLFASLSMLGIVLLEFVIRERRVTYGGDRKETRPLE